MDISFVITTNNKRPEQLKSVVKAIHYQNIPQYEIILVGVPPKENNNIFNNNCYSLDASESAKKGLLGDMRNRACETAGNENLVLLDDDMILSKDWYKNLLNYKQKFDILTSQVRLPDGTRFWDHCCFQSRTKGHSILEEYETDDNLYMSGGQAWVMKQHVFEKAKWDGVNYDMTNMTNLTDYAQGKHNEDTDFSRKCLEAGFKISHCHQMIAFHDDSKYTCLGRVVRSRKDGKSYSWVKDVTLSSSPRQIAIQVGDLFNRGFHAEAFDVARESLKSYLFEIHISEAVELMLRSAAMGLILSDDRWTSDGDESYLEHIEFYKSFQP